MADNGPDSLAALIAEATAPQAAVAVPLDGDLFHVLPTWRWPWRAVTHLLQGSYHRWARDAFVDEQEWRLWAASDPTNRQVRAFLTDWGRRGGDDVAAIARLAPILTAHHAALVGDLALIGYDLRDLWRPNGGPNRLTWRHLASVFDALPGQCLTKTAIRDALGDERLAELASTDRTGHGAWSHEALRLASLEDAVRVLVWRFMQVHFKDVPDTAPEPVPRPGIAGKRRQRMDPKVAAYLAHLRANRGAAPPGTKDLGRIGG